MTKPIKTLEFHYPIIQFLIIQVIRSESDNEGAFNLLLYHDLASIGDCKTAPVFLLGLKTCAKAVKGLVPARSEWRAPIQISNQFIVF